MYRRYVYDDSAKPGNLVAIVQGDELAVDDYLSTKYDSPKYGYSKRLRRKDTAPQIVVKWSDTIAGYEIVKEE